jgi:hypothetical protein
MGLDADAFKPLLMQYEGANSYTRGYGNVDLSNAPLNQYGFPQWEGRMGPQGISHAAGFGQFEPKTWEPYAKKLGITDFSPESQDKVYRALYADQGTAPWLPYNPKLRDAYNRALAGNTKMLPLGNARFASQLMPADPLGRSLLQTQLMGDDTGPADPAQAVTPTDPILAKLQGGSGGVGDVIGQYKQLASLGGGNPSSILAHMAAGFLGGKGPAQSLAGGFAGLAEGQKEGDSQLADLLKYQMLYGPALQQKREQTLLTSATNLAARGKTPIGQAYRVFGLPPEPGKSYEQMDDEWMKSQPLPATAQKAVQTHVDEIGKLGQLQNQFVTTAKQLDNGEFHTDRASQLKYAGLLNDPTGLLKSQFPETYAEALKYNSWTQTREQARQVVQNAQKGALSDERSKASLQAIIGGAGGIDDKALASHLNLLANNTALDITRHKNDVEAAYKGAGRKPPDDFWSSQNLPEAPLSGKTPEEISKNLYGQNYTSSPPKSAPATVAAPIATGPDGRKYQPSPDGTSWVPIQ